MPFSSCSSFELRSARLFSAALIVLSALAASQVSAQTTYSSTGGPTASGANGSGSNTIPVSNATGSVSAVSVTLTGVTSTGEGSYDSVGFTSFVLSGPGGQQFVLLGATGDGTDGNDNGNSSGAGMHGVNITIVDTASTPAPGAESNGTTGHWPQTGTLTVLPSSYWLSPYSDPADSSLPSGISSDSVPQSDGSATLNGTFGNSVGNGDWTLSVITEDPSGNSDQVSVGSWSLTLSYNVTQAAQTNTAVQANVASPATAGAAVTYTATVTSTNTVSSGSVTFSSNGTPIACSQSNPVPVSNGQAACTTTFSTQGLYNIKASYGGNSNFSSSSGSMDELYETATTQSGTTFCNPGSIAIAQSGGVSGIYPSVIKVTGYPGQTVSNVTVTLNDVSGNIVAQHLLVAPDGAHNLDFLDNGFSSVSAVSGSDTLNFYDSAGIYPNPANNPTSPYDYEASDTNGTVNADTFPASSAPTYDTTIPQVPETINYGYDAADPSETRGPASETFASSFGGVTADGDWVLYPFEGDAYGETISGGWCIDLTLNTGTPTTTSVASSANPATTGTAVTLTSTVTADSSPVASGGTATYLDNDADPTCTTGCSSGSNVVNLNGSGQAAFPFTGLYYTISTGVSGDNTTYENVYEGDHAFTVDYSGTATDNPSIGSIVQRMDNATTISSGSGGSFNACNAGPILSGQGSHGAFTPNPSNIFVTNLPGTVNAVTLTLENLYSYGAGANELESLVEGPTGAALDFFSSAGDGNTILSEGNYNFADAASGEVPDSSFGPGAYQPTAYQNNNSSADSFTSSASGFYNKPNSFNYAAPHGSSDFAGTFNGTIPNGTWSLFFNEAAPEDSMGVANGWCLNFVENPPVAAATLTNSSPFTQGEQGAQFAVNVTNSGPGSTGDPTGTNPMTVSYTPNGAFTSPSGSGTGWSCSGTAPLVCTNDSPVADGGSYPQLTLSVNVSGAATGTIPSSVTVGGAGANATSAADNVTIDIAPAITSGNSASFITNSPGTFQVSATGTPTPALSESGLLPNGVTFVDNGNGTASLSGTPATGTAGNYPFTITASNGIGANAEQPFTLMVSSPGPGITLSTNSLSYGNQTVTTSSASQPVLVTNTGTATLTFSSIAVTGTNSSSFVFGNTCGSSLAPGANCTIHGHFAPVAPGSQTAYVTITDNASGSPQQISLNGFGNGPAVQLSQNSLSYGVQNVGTSSDSMPVTLTNTGNASFIFNSITVTGPDASSFVFGDDCATGLAPNSSCTIHGHFAPTTTGPLSAQVTIKDNAGNSPQAIALSGTGGVPAVSLSSNNISYGAQDVGTSSASQTVTLTNTGTGPLGITGINVTGANASSFIFQTSCGDLLAAGAQCTIHGHFDPTATGLLQADVTITSLASEGTDLISLSGTGQ